MNQSWMVLRSSSGSGLVSGGGASVLVFLVRQIFFNSCFKWPFVVAGESGRCLEMISSVSPGQVARRTFLIAWTNIEGAGLKHAAWRNWSNYFCYCSYVQWHWLPVLLDKSVYVGCPIDHLIRCD